jgi:hypothetical protein
LLRRHNYILRAKVIKPKVKGEPVIEPVANNKVNKANKVDLPLNSLLVNYDTVTLLPLVILYLEPHHITPESTERLVLN